MPVWDEAGPQTASITARATKIILFIENLFIETLFIENLLPIELRWSQVDHVGQSSVRARNGPSRRLTLSPFYDRLSIRLAQ
jgi:hypothetical protein